MVWFVTLVVYIQLYVLPWLRCCGTANKYLHMMNKALPTKGGDSVALL